MNFVRCNTQALLGSGRAHLVKALVGAALMVGASSAQATTLNFDTIATGNLTTAYAAQGITFSQTIVANYGSLSGYSAPNVATGSSGSYFTQANAIRGIFDSGMVSQFVSFTGLDVGAAGVRIDAFDINGNLLNFTQIFGIGQGIDAVNQVSVSAADIHSFAIYQAMDGHPYNDGIVIDNISFTLSAIAPSSAVPEPATWAMMIGGMALAGASMRRRAVAVSVA